VKQPPQQESYDAHRSSVASYGVKAVMVRVPFKDQKARVQIRVRGIWSQKTAH
jgi:hypothetical protein